MSQRQRRSAITMTYREHAAVLLQRGGELLQGRKERREGGKKRKEEKPTHLTQTVGQRKGKRRSSTVLNEQRRTAEEL